MLRLLNLLAILLLSSSCLANNSQDELTIIYSNDLMGELEPCG